MDELIEQWYNKQLNIVGNNVDNIIDAVRQQILQKAENQTKMLSCAFFFIWENAM